MNVVIVSGLHDGRAVLDALPVGVALYDEQRRLVLSNPALTRTLGLPDTALRQGSTLVDNSRMVAHRGLLGPGDPEAQALEIDALDFDQPRRIQRRHPDGRTFEAHYAALPSGGILVCVMDTSALVAMRDQAERTLARIHAAVADLRIGLAVFAPDRTLALHNRGFTELLGLAPATLGPATPFADLLMALHARDDYGGLEGDLFLAGQMSLDRTRPSSFRRTRASGQVLDIQSDPLPDGGWSLTVTDITLLARAEDEARRRAALLDSIVHKVPHGIVVFGPDRRVALVNHAYGRIMNGVPFKLGDTQEEMVRTWAELGEYGPGDPAEHVRRQLAHDVTTPQIRQRRRNDGSMIEVRTAPLPDGGHISVVTDVTRLTEAQGEISRNAELMASIVSHIPHGVSVYGPDRALRLVNAAYNRIMDGAPIAIGDTVEAVIEKRARAGEYGPGDPAEVLQRQRAFDNSLPQVRRRTRPNGSTIDIRTAPLPDGGHISVVTDVSPLVAAEAELSRRAASMDAMLANIRHGIILWDQDSRIVAANAVVAELLMAPPDLLVPGTSLQETIQSALDRGNLGDGATAQSRARWLLEQDRSRTHNDQRLTRAGRVLEVRSDPTPGGGFVTTYTDVTQTREAEDALRLAKSAAEAANAAKSRFLASMSAELRNPLNAILAETAALAREANDARTRGSFGAEPAGLPPEAVMRACDAATASARRLLALIDSILDVARLEAGRFDLAEDTVDVAQMVRQCLRQSDSAAAAAEVALVVDLPDSIPRIRCDERRMRQALAHLVNNAVRFTGAMGSVSLSARQEWPSGDLMLHVEDTGIGIPEADLERVFEPFTQLTPTRPGDRRATGAGLGLYISRTLLRAHGGDVVLRSLPGQGTTAILRIPAARVLQDASTQDGALQDEPRDPT